MGDFKRLQGEYDNANTQHVYGDHVTMSLVDHDHHWDQGHGSVTSKGSLHISQEEDNNYAMVNGLNCRGEDTESDHSMSGGGPDGGGDEGVDEDDDDGWVPDIKQRQRFSPGELSILESTYEEHPLPSPFVKKTLAKQLGTKIVRIQIWFQNRRAKDKKRNRKTVHRSLAATVTPTTTFIDRVTHDYGMDGWHSRVALGGTTEAVQTVPTLTTRPTAPSSPLPSLPLPTVMPDPWRSADAGVSVFWGSPVSSTEQSDFYDSSFTTCAWLPPMSPSFQGQAPASPSLVASKQTCLSPGQTHRRINTLLTHEVADAACSDVD